LKARKPLPVRKRKALPVGVFDEREHVDPARVGKLSQQIEKGEFLMEKRQADFTEDELRRLREVADYAVRRSGAKAAFEAVLPKLIALGHEPECQGRGGYGSPVDGLEWLMREVPRTAGEVWDFLEKCGEHPLSGASVIKLHKENCGGAARVYIGGDKSNWPVFVPRAMALLAQAGLDPPRE
jgi:hypothetical protein